MHDYAHFLNHSSGINWGFFKEENVLAAYFLGIFSHGEVDIISIATRPEYRRQGLGRKLVEKILSLESVNQVVLEVDKENEAAVSMYLSLDFKIISIRKNYYRGQRDAWRMVWQRPVISSEAKQPH
jgi:ribosomal-protein-alanine N-acetyltransferase